VRKTFSAECCDTLVQKVLARSHQESEDSPTHEYGGKIPEISREQEHYESEWAITDLLLGALPAL
jgi:hypothetical protein